MTDSAVEISLSRSSQGHINLRICTAETGLIQVEMTEKAFADLMFGLTAVPGKVTRHLPGKKPTPCS